MRISPTCTSTSLNARPRKSRSSNAGARPVRRARRSRDSRSGTHAGWDPTATRASWRGSSSSSNASRKNAVEIYRKPLTAAEIKAKARELGADLVGIADGARLDTSRITELDGGRVIVLAKHLNDGVARIRRWDDRHKYYNDELALTHLEETSLELVYWLEDCGYPALIVPPTHVDPSRYSNQPAEHIEPMLSLPHAAVEAGLGTLGLNLQLLTPAYGPRVILTAVLSSVPVECDRPMTEALCRGPSCGRCLKTCPGDAVLEWDRDGPACDRHRSPHGFAQ